jgi:membrane protein DedA with SNARE-associated domain
MRKPKFVCVLGSVVLTPLLISAAALIVVIVISAGITFEWIPQPPAHNDRGVFAWICNGVMGLLLLFFAFNLYRWLYRKCSRQSGSAPLSQ